MKAAQLVEKRRMEVVDIPAASTLRDQVRVRVTVAGICGSDVHYFTHGGLGTFKNANRFPLSLGHEAAGIIEIDGGDFNAGQRVAINPAHPCGTCDYCVFGRPNLCSRGTFMGANYPGAFRETVYVSPEQLTPLPDSVSDEEGAMLEPLSVAMHAVALARVQLGMSVAVFGAGPIGLCVAMVARASGAGRVAIFDPNEQRVHFGVKNYDINFGTALRWNERSDVAFDCAGMEKSVQDAFECAEPGGKVVLVGIPTFDWVRYNPHVARTKELTIINVRRSRESLDACLRLLQARNLPLGKLVTHRWPLEEIQTAFETVEGYRDGVLKGVITLG